LIGQWRSPEEYQDLPLDEKIDVFSLGNNLFSILTGLSPFYSASGFQEVQRLVAQGMKPYLDPRWKERSFAERTIVELIHRCHAYDPKDRIDVGAAVKFLRDAIRTNKLHHSHEDKLV
jgi:serine/threonine protein kinase